MFTVGAATKIYLATGVTDLRQGYNGLYAQIKSRLGREPLSGDLYVFCNQRRESLKIFFWDGSGLCLFGKRLQKGTFRWPSAGESSVVMTATQLHLLLEGIDLARTKPRAWWRHVNQP
jgi:transposase